MADLKPARITSYRQIVPAKPRKKAQMSSVPVAKSPKSMTKMAAPKAAKGSSKRGTIR